MKKKVVLLSIIIFPSLIYFVFELTQANFKKMAYFGPKTVNAKGDTVYWSVPDITFFTHSSYSKKGDTFSAGGIGEFKIDTASYPVFCILFLNKDLSKEGYKLDGLIDYLRFKAKDLKDVPIIFISSAFSTDEYSSSKFHGDTTEVSKEYRGEFDSIPVKLPNFISARLPVANRDSFLKATYFKQKPVYVFDYFMVLVDKKRHIRGYYDPTFNAEIKRMIQEYQHLKIRDEYAETQKQNDIKQK